MPLEMNSEIRAQWCAALRSGEYKQTTGHLRTGLGSETRHCCLGVLTDLAEKAGVPDVPWDHDILPPVVAQWAGMPEAKNGRPDCNPYLFDPAAAPDGLAAAAELNDDGWTFAEIANAIDGGEAA